MAIDRRKKMNFSDAETQGCRGYAWFIEEEGTMVMENPNLVKAEEEFFASRGAKKPKTEVGPSTVAGPSALVINIEDSDESELSDFDSDNESSVDWKTLMRESGL
ncbi:hypothetical protein ZWY2020_034352 [Hordeum vulgare]|nr:hypothetical protein ZWY2020_034352 [Hordeum vulgare]